jgi:O-antigen/teichoic acid export membrane protein
MRARGLVRGIAVGYVLKALQTAAAIGVIPFLLRDDVIGVARYGHAFTLMMATSVVNVVTDGFKVSLSRSISSALSESPSEAARFLGAGTRLLATISCSAAAALLLLCDPVLQMLGLPVDREYRFALAFTASMIVSGEAFAGFRSLLLAHGHLDFINFTHAVDVVGRCAFFLLYFSHFEGTVSVFLGAFAVGAAAKAIACALFAVHRYRVSLIGWTTAPARDAIPLLKYSFSISLSTIYYFLFFRLSVPVVNRFLGGEAAGLLALVLNLAHTYVREAFLAVVEPTLVPLAARIQPRQFRTLRAVDRCYRAVVLAVASPLLALAPYGLSFWLGEPYSGISRAIEFMLTAVVVQTALTLQRSVAIARGEASTLAAVATPSAALSVAVFALSVFWIASWEGAVLAIAGFSLAVDFLGTSRAFLAALGTPPVGWWKDATAALIALAPAAGLSVLVRPESIWAALAVGMASVAMTLWLTHVLVERTGAVARTLNSIRTHRDLDLFGASE